MHSQQGPAQFDGDNSYPDCRKCGTYCTINVLCMTSDDYRAIKRSVAQRGITPTDYGKKRCCFQTPDFTCMIWDARPQVCRLFNCHIPRREVLQMDPSIQVDEDLWMVDMHEAFVYGTVDDDE